MKEEHVDGAISHFKETPGEVKIKQEFGNVIDSKLAFFCDECGKEKKTKGHLLRHVQMVHKKMYIKCDKCDYKATDKRYVERHSLSVHENQKTRFICTICSHQLKTLSALKSHEARKHKELPHACSSCEYKTSDKSSLKKHISAVHEGIKFPCHLCQYRASAQNSLRKHIVGIHSEAKFECDQCSLQTNFQSNLIQHKQAMHKSPAKFRCDLCNWGVLMLSLMLTMLYATYIHMHLMRTFGLVFSPDVPQLFQTRGCESVEPASGVRTDESRPQPTPSRPQQIGKSNPKQLTPADIMLGAATRAASGLVRQTIAGNVSKALPAVANRKHICFLLLEI